MYIEQLFKAVSNKNFLSQILLRHPPEFDIYNIQKLKRSRAFIFICCNKILRIPLIHNLLVTQKIFNFKLCLSHWTAWLEALIYNCLDIDITSLIVLRSRH